MHYIKCVIIILWHNHIWKAWQIDYYSSILLKYLIESL